MTNQYQRFSIKQFRDTGTKIATISVENRASWLLQDPGTAALAIGVET